MDNIDFQPGSIYFMMILESFNLYMSSNITCVRYSFTNLSLSNYPVHNVRNLATTALKLIKTMQQGYTPPVELRSKILLKVSDNSCEYFNLQVFTYLEKALTLEQKYKLLDPKLMLQGSEYPTY